MLEKQLTLAFVVEDSKVLLGMKKRGFGAGLWNGFGGKLDMGETVEEAAKRELEEEVNIIAKEMEYRGTLRFSFDSDPVALVVDVFLVTEHEGEPTETEEMKPEWFSFESIPYDSMWPDDSYWLPVFLAGKRFEGRFHFDAPSSPDHTSTVLSAEVKELD
jgi:8-oxo-dGTP diphosphatase / 2-hydroxy-dATP diphosphatase